MRSNSAFLMALRWLLAAIGALALAGCGGGGGSSSSTPTPTPTPSATPSPTGTGANTVAVVVDGGPAAIAGQASNTPYVTVKICAPGSTSNCQTIDHVLVDTGSVGFRVIGSVINASLLAALPEQTDASSNPVGECYTYVDGFVFGSVRSADFTIGSKSVAAMPFQVIGDAAANFTTPPTSCSSGGGSNEDTVQLFDANGIIGIGGGPTDCGTYCTTASGQSGAIYYDCPATGCSAMVARTSTTTAPFEQLPNPVAAFSTDNNGTVLSLPSVAAAGVATLNGTLYFGIATETNNALGSAKILTADDYGDLTASYTPYGTSTAQRLTSSFLDTGSPFYYFVDTGITACTQSGYTPFYCPASALSLTPTLTGANSTSESAAFTLYNVETQTAATANAFPGIGVNPNVVNFANPVTNSFDFGLPFFYGRNVYTAIAGRTAGGTTGPYVAY